MNAHILARRFSLFAFVALSLLNPLTMRGQPAQANQDESKVPKYTLPDPLVTEEGTRVTKSSTWERKRRPENLHLFEQQVYGRSPAAPKRLIYEITSVDENALGGKATRKEVAIYLAGKKGGPKMDLLLYLPNDVKGKVPMFLGLNFEGNHSIHKDPGITLSTQWVRTAKEKGIVNNRATEDSRGKSSGRWPVEMILERGYGLATAYYGDLEPDFNEGYKTGIRSQLGQSNTATTSTNFAPDAWGAIGAWAWGLSRAVDYLEKDKKVDAKRVALLGHSRLGKTALWAGAQDERFGVVISNNSGEGGASLSRRRFGETVARINTSFPHWFCENFKKYNNNEDALPVDQHMLIALIAPRAVYVASAQEDLWADPRGEFLSAKHAEPVYALYGKKGLGVDDMPGLNKPVGEQIGYHIRTGKHDVTDYDWEQYLNFADRHFKKAR